MNQPETAEATPLPDLTDLTDDDMSQYIVKPAPVVQGANYTQFNRAFRRRLKKLLKLPFTPSIDFAEKYMAKMEQAGAVRRIDKVPQLPKAEKRAFEGADDAGV